MATISTSGISALQVIKSDHILRVINTLDGTLSNDIIISGSTNLKLLYAPSMVGPTSFTGSFTATHTTDSKNTYAIVGENTTNSGSGVQGSSISGYGVYARSTNGTGLDVSGYSCPIAKFWSGTGNQQMQLFNNGNLLLNTGPGYGNDQADKGYKLYVGGNTYLSGTLMVGPDNISGTPTFGFTPTTVIGSSSAAAGGGVLDIRNIATSISAGSTLGTIQFSGRDDATVAYSMAQIRATANLSAGGGDSGGGNLRFYTSPGGGGGTPQERMFISASGLVNMLNGLVVTGSVTINNILTLTPTGSLPSGQPTGSFMVSGSNGNCKPYFYNGATWTALF